MLFLNVCVIYSYFEKARNGSFEWKLKDLKMYAKLLLKMFRKETVQGYTKSKLPVNFSGWKRPYNQLKLLWNYNKDMEEFCKYNQVKKLTWLKQSLLNFSLATSLTVPVKCALLVTSRCLSSQFPALQESCSMQYRIHIVQCQINIVAILGIKFNNTLSVKCKTSYNKFLQMI